MNLTSTRVAIQRCRRYERAAIKACLEAIFQALSFHIARSAAVLLKPNLVAGIGHGGLACSHPEFVAAVAEWFLDHGVRVGVGDSPAFGRAPAVMAACGMADSLRGLPVRQRHFREAKTVMLASGLRVGIARDALECDCLVNLPKVKAHSQTLVSLAVKNCFGTVKGLRKALLHQQLGGDARRFAGMLVDLLAVLPDGISVCDGIEAMAGSGPMDGVPYSLGVIAGSTNPVALDTALLTILGVEPEKSMVWRETRRQNLNGWRLSDLVFPLLRPEEVTVEDFRVPDTLKPIIFQPRQILRSLLRRLGSQW
ncbi:MAG: DUF362 domain-containing protein [Thermodesulfobacteriota bacterium]